MALARGANLLQLGPREDLARRVVRRAQQQHARAGERGVELGGVVAPAVGALAQRHRARVQPEDCALARVQLVEGLEEGDIVAGRAQRAQADRKPLGGAEHHRDVLVGVRRNLGVEGGKVRLQPLAQQRHPERERVLVELVLLRLHHHHRLQPLAHRLGRRQVFAGEQRARARRQHLRRRRLVRKPLREVDRAVLDREPRHETDGALGWRLGHEERGVGAGPAAWSQRTASAATTPAANAAASAARSESCMKLRDRPAAGDLAMAAEGRSARRVGGPPRFSRDHHCALGQRSRAHKIARMPRGSAEVQILKA